MSDLINKIQNDLNSALKSKNEIELNTLRLLKSDIQYEMTKTGAKELPEGDIQAIVKRAIKKRADASEQYRAGGRADVADKELSEAEILKRYLPEEVSEAEIQKRVDEIVSELNNIAPGDTGKIMGRVMGHFKGKNVDGNLVRQLVQKKIQKLS